MNKSFYIFLILFFINLYIDFSTKETQKCIKKNSNVIIILIIHHFFSTFLHFGWVIQNKIVLKLYICIGLFTIINWTLFNHCQVTTYTNKMCTVDSSNKYSYFQDIVWWFGLKDCNIWNNYLHAIYIILCIMIAYNSL